MHSRVAAAALVALLLALSGCSVRKESAEAVVVGHDAAASGTWLPQLSASFDVLTRSGATTSLHGWAWLPVGGADVAILLVHGFGGESEILWNIMPEQGQAFGPRLAAKGLAVFAIPLPGYKGAGDGTLSGVDDQAWVVDQVADALRNGAYQVQEGDPRRFGRVYGYGNSLGGMAVGIAQGVFASFDQVIIAGWSHGRFNPEMVHCLAKVQTGAPIEACPSDPRSVNFVVKKTNFNAIDRCERNQEAGSAGHLATAALWMGAKTPASVVDPLAPLSAGPAPYDITNRITVPVLVMIGDGDYYWDQNLVGAEPSHFTASPRFQLERPPDTGHNLHMHLNEPEIADIVDSFLRA